MNGATFSDDNIDYKDRISTAIADLDLQEVPNYGATAKKYGLERTTLWRRHTAQTVSRSEATTESRQVLNGAQEKVLIGHIGRLVPRGTPPHPAIVRNIAEEMHGAQLEKNWVTRPSFTSSQKHVYAKYRQFAQECRICPNVSAILWAGMSPNSLKNENY